MIGVALVTLMLAVGPADAQAAMGDPYSWPVQISHGQRFVNEEYGLSAMFPEGAAVCVAQSGTHHHGYYGRMGYRGAACSPSGDTRQFSTLMAYGDYNAADYKSPSDLLSCPSAGAAVEGPDGRQFAFRGLPSAACAEIGEDGRVRISVVALAGKNAGQDTPALIYSAYLIAPLETLATDKVLFEKFLDELGLSPPSLPE